MAEKFSLLRKLSVNPAQQSTRGTSSFDGVADLPTAITQYTTDWVNLIVAPDSAAGTIEQITVHDNTGSTKTTRGATAVEQRTQQWVLNVSFEDWSPEILNEIVPSWIGQDAGTGTYPDLTTVPAAGVCVPVLDTSEAPYFEWMWDDTNQTYFGWGNAENFEMNGSHEGKVSGSFTVKLLGVSKTTIGDVAGSAPSAVSVTWASTPTAAGNQIMSWGSVTSVSIGGVSFVAAKLWNFSVSMTQALFPHHDAGDTGLYPNNILLGNTIESSFSGTFSADQSDIDAIVGTTGTGCSITVGGITFTCEDALVETGAPGTADDQAVVAFSAKGFYAEGSSSGFLMVASGLT